MSESVPSSRSGLAARVRRRVTFSEQRRGIRPRDAALVIVALWLAAVVVWGVLEHLMDKRTFPTIWLGMWWALQTVTTVGYGDVVPASDAGRAVASLLLLGGLAFISVVTASITTGFVTARQRELRESGEDPVLERLDAIAKRLDDLERDVGALRRPAAPAEDGPGASARDPADGSG
jgi:hypothetical protein